MNSTQFKSACNDFIAIAAPYLKIQDESHYHEALDLIESLMEEVGEDSNNPIDLVIDLLANAISEYENHSDEISNFEKSLPESFGGIDTLRVLMDQHQLGVADLPEIGSKSMVSRVLSGERDLSKNHIEKLSKRFGITPALFF